MKKPEQKTKEWCGECQQWLAHVPAYCPLFPKVGGVEKWTECVCTVHTCYDAKAMGIKCNKRTAPTYKDFVAYDPWPAVQKIWEKNADIDGKRLDSDIRKAVREVRKRSR